MNNFLDKFASHIREDIGHRDNPVGKHIASPQAGRQRLKNAARIEVDKIITDPQHREQFSEESIARLAESIKAHKQLQPIRVRWDESRGKYVVVAGERRLRAVRYAELPTIECLIADEHLTENDILIQQIIENCQREDLQPVERAKAFKELMERQEWDGKRLAQELKVSEGTVSNSLKLLQLDPQTQRQIDTGQLKPTLAIQQARQNRCTKRKGKRAKPHTETIRVGGGVTIEIRFRKSTVSGDDIDQALRRALEQRQQIRSEAA